jgi:hypothetical protein
MEHVNTPINEIVVMYQSFEQIIRPPAPPDVVRGRGLGSQSSVPHLLVTDCARTKQTVWIEDQLGSRSVVK